jgi:hypothetical protein
MLVFWDNRGRKKEVNMNRKRYTPEQIIEMLRKA